MGWRPTVEARCGPRRALRVRVGSCGGLHEIADPHQVVNRRGEGEEPADPSHPTEFAFRSSPTVFNQPKISSTRLRFR